MLHAPTNDRKAKPETSSKTTEHLSEKQQPTNLLRSRRSQPMQQRENLAAMQNAYGNQAVLRMRQEESQRSSRQDSLTFIQPKLNLSKPGDKYEQEADQVAERVMQISDSQVSLTPLKQSLAIESLPKSYGQRLDRQVMADEDVEKTMFNDVDSEQSEEDIEPDETGMPKRENGSSDLTPAEVSSVDIPREGGSPLTKEVRNFMEPRFDYDFGKVNIHTNTASVQSAQQLNARAYTVGENIYFNQGQYTPDSNEGRKLLAHELTHVIQQSNSRSSSRKTLQKKGCSAGSCPQGKQKKVIRDDCAASEPTDKDHFIKSLTVALSSQTVTVEWSDGTSETWPCSPNPDVTPTGKDVVGVKCSIKHTNKKKDGMAWFTGFQSEGLRIGFHDSQRVGTGIHSHGCVRVCCDKAEIINKNSWSGKTTIQVN